METCQLSVEITSTTDVKNFYFFFRNIPLTAYIINWIFLLSCLMIKGLFLFLFVLPLCVSNWFILTPFMHNHRRS